MATSIAYLLIVFSSFQNLPKILLKYPNALISLIFCAINY